MGFIPNQEDMHKYLTGLLFPGESYYAPVYAAVSIIGRKQCAIYAYVALADSALLVYMPKCPIGDAASWVRRISFDQFRKLIVAEARLPRGIRIQLEFHHPDPGAKILSAEKKI